MARNRLANSNVIRFPRSDELRLERAIDRFDSSDHSRELKEEFTELAASGLREANYFLGLMYEDGSNGAARSPENALVFYEESVRGFGYVEGYLAAARLLYHGIGVKVDYHRALQYYDHVARNNGHPVACFMLGRMYQHGQGTQKDLSAARSWYLKSISAGNVYGMLNLAMLEAEEGRILRSALLRLRAGSNAFLIALRDRKDVRLRGG